MAKETSETVRTVPGESPESVAERLKAESEAEASANTEPQNDPPKRKRGRPRGSKTRNRSTRATAPREPVPEPQAEAEAVQAQIAQLVQQMTSLTHRLVGAVVDRKFPDNPYRMDEAAELTAAIVPVAMKHGEAFAEWLPEITLVGVCVAQFAGRDRPPGRDVTQLSLLAETDVTGRA